MAKVSTEIDEIFGLSVMETVQTLLVDLWVSMDWYFYSSNTVLLTETHLATADKNLLSWMTIKCLDYWNSKNFNAP